MHVCYNSSIQVFRKAICTGPDALIGSSVMGLPLPFEVC